MGKIGQSHVLDLPLVVFVKVVKTNNYIHIFGMEVKITNVDSIYHYENIYVTKTGTICVEF